MTLEEFSNEFDTQLNSYNTITFGSAESAYSINLDEYEKSVLLTKAQEEIVISLYSGSFLQETFENTEQLRRYLSSLVYTTTIKDKELGYIGVSNNSSFFKLPDDVWFITYETAELNDSTVSSTPKKVLVTPVSQDEFYKIERNPFKGASKHRVLRLDITDNMVEIVSQYNIDSYTVRYLKKPTPIILINLPDGLTIDSEATMSDCLLDPSIHRSILDRAVQLAVASRTPKTKEDNSKESDK